MDFPLLGKWYLESDTSSQYIFDAPTYTNGKLIEKYTHKAIVINNKMIPISRKYLEKIQLEA